MYTMRFRAYSAKELAEDAKRPFRFEIWREEPNPEQYPYRRKHDQRTILAWKSLDNRSDWREVLALIKRNQRITKIHTFIRRASFGARNVRYVKIRIENRKKK